MTSTIRFFEKHNGNKTDFCSEKFLSTTGPHWSVTVVLSLLQPTAELITAHRSSPVNANYCIATLYITLKLRPEHCLHLTDREHHEGAQTTLRKFIYCGDDLVNFCRPQYFPLQSID